MNKDLVLWVTVLNILLYDSTYGPANKTLDNRGHGIYYRLVTEPTICYWLVLSLECKLVKLHIKFDIRGTKLYVQVTV